MTDAPARNAAIVTGGTRGIGRAISTRLARDGWDLLATYHSDNDAAAQAQEELRAFGGRVEILAADISKPDGAGQTIEAAMTAFGKIDALVNNAGITRDTLIMRMSEDDWDAVLSTNLKGAFLTSKAAVRPMLRQRSGRIVNLTSVVGLVGNAGQANYAASKAGLIGFTKSLAREVASRGITVNALAPGLIETDMTAVLSDEIRKNILGKIPLNALGQPDDIASAVARRVEDELGDLADVTVHIEPADERHLRGQRGHDPLGKG